MKIITQLFGRDPRFSEMLKVFTISARLNNPNVPIVIYWSDINESIIKELSLLFNNIVFKQLDLKVNYKTEAASQKLYHYRLIVSDPDNNNENIVLLDCDTLILNNLSKLFNKKDFDFAYTEKDYPAKFLINSGVVFFRNSPKVINFFHKWYSESLLILSNHKLTKLAAEKYGSVDQQILDKLINNTDLTIKKLPTSIYNVHHDWSSITKQTQIIHFKNDWYKILLYPGSYVDAIRVNGWKWPNMEKWEAAWRIWRNYHHKYKLMYYKKHPFKILYLCNNHTYQTKMSRVRFHNIAAIAKKSQLIYSGIGWPNYNNLLSAHLNILNIYSGDYPDIVVAYKPLELKDFAGVRCPKIITYNEMWNIKDTRQEIVESGANLIIAHHANDISRYTDLKQVKFVHIAHCAEKTIYKDYFLPKTIDVLLVGSLEPYHYPFRNRLKSIIEHYLAPYVKCEILAHPLSAESKGSGLTLQNYARKINSAKITLTCSMRWKYRLGKYTEIPMSGSLLAADLPAEDQKFFRQFMLVLNPYDTDQIIAKKILYYVKHDSARNKLVQRGIKLNRQYTQEHYAQRFLIAVKSYLCTQPEWDTYQLYKP